MRKTSLLGAALLLLAAGTACNRQMEKDILPTDGFVKLRFAAVVDEETRTAYQNDKTASWVEGDKISVYVTNGSEGQVATFTADASLTFEGTVPAGFTTVVAGAYPADAAHTFDASGVKTLHLPASYTLADGADAASVLPLVGTFADGQMNFRHPAGALKFTLDNVPAEAVRFRFTSADQKINGSFNLDPALAETSEEAEKAVDVVFPAAAGSRSFYVPMPAGTLAAESAIALYDAEDHLLFKKVVPAALSVNKNVIKRIAAVETWTKNDAWQAAYLRDSYSKTNSKVSSIVGITGTTGKYGFALYTKSSFYKSYDGAGAFLASDYIVKKKEGGATGYSKNGTYSYNKLSPGPRVVVIYGVDDEYNFTGEYNLIEFEVPAFTTPEGWSLAFNPEYEKSDGSIVPAITVKTPEGTTWGFNYMTSSTFATNYGSDVAAYIWSKRTATDDLRTSKGITSTLSTLTDNTYIFIIYGMTERPAPDSDRTPTFEYCLLEVTYTKPAPPTEAYSAWIGKWSVADGSKTDTWTVSAKVNNVSYKVKGMGGNGGFTNEALFDAETGQMKFKSQPEFTTVVKDGETRVISLFGTDGSHYTTGTYDLMYAAFDDGTTDAATLTSCNPEKYTKYKFYGYVDGQSKYNYGTRTLPSTMTRVVSDDVLPPDGWSVIETGTDLMEAGAPDEAGAADEEAILVE